MLGIEICKILVTWNRFEMDYNKIEIECLLRSEVNSGWNNYVWLIWQEHMKTFQTLLYLVTFCTNVTLLCEFGK